MAQPRRRERDLTPREYARRYQEAYGPQRNLLATIFNWLFAIGVFILMLIAIQASLANLFRVDPFAWMMTRLVGPSHIQIGPAPAPTAALSIQSQPPAAVVVPQEQPAAVQEQAPAAAQPTDVPAAPAQPQEQPSELQAPVQEQAAPVATTVPTVAPTAAPKPKPTSWATADAFVVKSDFVKATPDPRFVGGWKSIPTK